MRDGSVMADSDLVDFLSGPTDSAINFNGSADLHTPIHPPQYGIHQCSFLSKHWPDHLRASPQTKRGQFRHDIRNVWNFTS